MRHVAPLALIALAVALAPGCRTTRTYTSYHDAFGDYQKVLDETIRVIDKYAFIMSVDRRAGRVVGEVQPDNRFFGKTRQLVYGEIYDRGGYFDVEVRVVYEMDESQADPFRMDYVAPYEWRHVSYDQFLETRLTNEIKNALSGGEYDKKQPLLAADVPAPEMRALEMPEGHVAIDSKLRDTKVNLNFSKTPFDEAVDFFAGITGLNLTIDPAVRDVLDGADVNLKVEGVSARNALELLLATMSPNLVYRIENEVIYITGTAPRDLGEAPEQRERPAY